MPPRLLLQMRDMEVNLAKNGKEAVEFFLQIRQDFLEESKGSEQLQNKFMEVGYERIWLFRVTEKKGSHC